MSAILILLMVGALIGVWNISGTIATMVYYGVKYIDPAWFYFAATLLTGIVGSNVYTHIKSMAKATVPAYLIALVIFFFIGRNLQVSVPPEQITAVLQALESSYNISLWNLLPVLVLLLPGLRKYPAFLSILIGTLAGALVAVLLQPAVVTAFANDPSLSYWLASLKSVWTAMANGFTATTAYEQINTLFSGGGMDSMLITIWLLLGAMSFGAMMDFGGFNARLITPVIDRVKSAGGTIATVMITVLGLNIVAGDLYITIVLPARMFMAIFRKRGLHPETLASAVENSGTVTSPLIPWNSCGAYMSAALGVSTFVYLPYCFFSFLNFILGMVYGFVGINVMRLDPEEQPALETLKSAPLVDLPK
jgi:NhaC family Na+:H+ antiporter